MRAGKHGQAESYNKYTGPSVSEVLVFQNLKNETEDEPVGFNYAKERRKFEDEWVKLRKQYREAGFSEEGIAAMRDYDEEVFRQQRRYYTHTQELPLEIDEDNDEAGTSLFEKFESLRATFDESDFDSRFAWVDTVDDPDLVARLKLLKESDLELLTLYAIDGYSQPEIARLLGGTQQNISLKINRIKNFLKKARD